MAATGNPQGGMGIGSHLSSRYGEDYPKVDRVLNRHGEISAGWKAVSPDLPATPEGVRELLQREGVTFVGVRASPQQRFDAKTWLSTRPDATGSGREDAIPGS